MLMGTSTFTADAQVFHVPSGPWDYHEQRINCWRMELTRLSLVEACGPRGIRHFVLLQSLRDLKAKQLRQLTARQSRRVSKRSADLAVQVLVIKPSGHWD